MSLSEPLRTPTRKPSPYLLKKDGFVLHLIADQNKRWMPFSINFLLRKSPSQRHASQPRTEHMLLLRNREHLTFLLSLIRTLKTSVLGFDPIPKLVCSLADVIFN